uniref:asparagine synthase (glutamine-hydrolyzing) n=1 Tax=viral metagenome TaxID=1070528 RepID=A0A6C0KGH6_9ZZZZ
MCGIFFICSKTGIFTDESIRRILSNFKLLKRRGPDQYALTIVGNCIIGFQRLAINDTSSNGMQPFQLGESFTMCNGEIYNYDDLKSEYLNILKSKSDCEVLPHMISHYGIEKTVQLLDGVFAIAHINTTAKTVSLARDRIGVKPVFYGESDMFFAAASEAKALDGLSLPNIQQLKPGSIVTYEYDTYIFQSVSNVSSVLNVSSVSSVSYEESRETIRRLLIRAVQKRMTSDRDIGCLLSGGLDSSIIASILANEMQKNGKKLRTFSVGFPDSTDIIYARQVAAHIQSDHQEYLIKYEDALQRIEDVVKATETYDTTTIRASTPMYLLCEWINKNFPDKVIFSGEGSDELFCGYLYFHNAPNAQEAHTDSLRLVNELYQYDVLRADRCTAGNGLEFREPFLDKDLVDFVVAMDPSYKIPSTHESTIFEKTILREAFSTDLPDPVAWRRKAAFSDAVSSSEKPWYQWIHEYVKNDKNDKNDITDYGGTTESNYYKTLFYKYFKDYKPTIPLWLPRWCNVGSEPSATVLNVYNKNEH